MMLFLMSPATYAFVKFERGALYPFGKVINGHKNKSTPFRCFMICHANFINALH